MTDVIGTVLGGRYRVLAKLGEGGMGTVFRAENTVTGKHVALKCMHAEISANPEASERLMREARAAARLSHPNVVDVYDVVQDGETLFLVMQLLQGETLGSYLLRHPMPKVSEFIALILPAMAGVAAAHECGVIHRDLKPDNIFLERVAGVDTGVAKVLDFGVAKLMAARTTTLTQTGMTLGTPLYMPLEQLRGDKDLDDRADVYAFGVMLYEAITGQLPHEAESVAELAIKVATTHPVPVKTLRPDMPAGLAHCIDSAVAREREQRPPSVRRLMQQLQPFAHAASFAAPVTQAEAEAEAPPMAAGLGRKLASKKVTDSLRAQEVVAPRAPRRSFWSVWLTGGVALAASLIGLAFLMRESPQAVAPNVRSGGSASAPVLNAEHTEISATTNRASLEGPHPLLAPGLDSQAVATDEASQATPPLAEAAAPQARTADATSGQGAAPELPPTGEVSAATTAEVVVPAPARSADKGAEPALILPPKAASAPSAGAARKTAAPTPAAKKKSSLERIGF